MKGNFKISSDQVKKNNRVKKHFSKGNVKGMFEKKTRLRKAAGHNSGPLLTTNTHYLGSIYFLIIGDFQILKYSIKICLKKYKNKK